MRNNRRDATSGAFSVFRVSEWSVRRKVVAVLALPVVLAVVFGGLRVRTELTQASDYATNQRQAGVLGPAVDYLNATQRLALPSSLADRMTADGKGSPDQAYAAAEANLRKAASASSLDATQAGLVSAVIKIGDQLRTGSGTGISATPSVQLSDMTRYTTQLVSSVFQGTPDRRVQAYTQAINARLSLVKQQLLIQSDSQQTSQLDAVWLAAEIGVEGQALAEVQAISGGRRVANLVAANGTRLGNATSSNPSALAATPHTFASYDAMSSGLLKRIDKSLSQQATATRSRALTDSATILLALLASLILALLTARTLLNSLRRVREGALEVAHTKLPETVRRIRDGKEPEEFTPIPVHTREELGQLARAVDDMHRQAVNLATGEAQLRSQIGAMFVTLSRRNTTLVNQQLALIESLEQDEEDPQRLEQLFSLDHLATRMRRTAESLVILGGTGGRTAGLEELSVSDVIHAAVSEVQDYQRVRIDAAPDRMISARAALDVVHLMAELIDNALSYSPPGTPVTIQAAEDGGRVEIEIIDSGLGMAGDALAKANESLKNGGEVTVDTARRMGLFVVSRLANEHGLKVKLRRNVNGGGIVASIVLPVDVLVSDEPVEHVSLMDAPEEQVEEPTPVEVEEPEEEYDPYLERIEEAIAAVTGLPRRRPGQAVSPPEPVPTPAAAVSMFDPGPSPQLPAGYEPVELPSLLDADVPSGIEESEPLETPAATALGMDEDLSAAEDTEDVEDVEDVEEFTLAPVVTADFGGDRGGSFRTEAEFEELGEAEELDEHPTEYVAESPDQEPGDEQGEESDEDLGQGAEEEVEDDTAEPVWAETSEEEPWDVDGAGPEPEPEPFVATAGYDEHVAEVAVETAPDAVPPPAASYDEPFVAAGQDAEPAVRLTIRRPLDATPAASALEGEHVPDDSDADFVPPIFGQLRSNWLNEDAESSWASREVDRGWNAAERVDAPEPEDTTRTGLPVRRPGGRLVPGGVSTEPTAVTRDPEAIRNRLAAHAAGVSRGRAAAAAQPMTDDYAHEETGPA